MHLGLIGYGSIGRALVALLTVEDVTKITVLVRSTALNAPEFSASGIPIQFVTSLTDLLKNEPLVVVECAGHTAIATYAQAILEAGTDLIVASVGAFADADLHDIVNATTKAGGAKLILPTGAIGGLDLLQVLATHGDVDVTYRGVKPPQAWKGSQAETITDLDALTEPLTFFQGSGREAALSYPKNANVVAALALSGAGFDTMKVALIADPSATTNTHAFEVTSPLCRYTIEIANTATADNPRTSMTTVASLQKLVLDYAKS
jgi:aspartate dehydrogenase